MPILTAFLLLAPTPGALFDACVAAHEKLERANVEISVRTKVAGRTLASRGTLQYIRPDRMLLTLQEPQQRGLAASDRVFALAGNEVVAVDRAGGEYTSRTFPFPAGLDLPTRVTTGLGEIGDTAMTLINPAQLKNLLNAYRNTPALQVGSMGALTTVSKSAGSTRVSFTFGSANHLLRKMHLETAANVLEWDMTYGASPATIQLPSVSGLRKVESLTARLAPPKYESAEAKALAARGEKTYGQMGSVVCRFTGPEMSGTFYKQGRSYRQETAAIVWVYAKGELTVRTSKGVFRGRVGASKVSSTLAKVGVTVEPMLLQFLQQRSPITTLLAAPAIVRVAGGLMVESAPCTILESRTSGLNLSLLVRKADGLIYSTRSRVKGRNGEVASGEEHSYRYSQINKPLPLTTFQLDGTGAQPLPK